jgi:hypothetical protein
MKRRGRERWGRKWVGERDQLCGEENEKRGSAGERENEKIKDKNNKKIILKNMIKINVLPECVVKKKRKKKEKKSVF